MSDMTRQDALKHLDVLIERADALVNAPAGGAAVTAELVHLAALAVNRFSYGDNAVARAPLRRFAEGGNHRNDELALICLGVLRAVRAYWAEFGQSEDLPAK